LVEFTIFTGTYNSEEIIDRVFQSINSQTYREFEWIVIDDCSKDNTVAKVTAFKSKHLELPITIIKHEKNTGIARSRKEAIQLAKGKYFVTWDHDDIQDSNQLEVFQRLWKLDQNGNVAFIFTKMKDQFGSILGINFPSDPFNSNYLKVYNSHLVGNASKGNVVEHHVCAKTAKYVEVLEYYENHPQLLLGRLPNGADVWAMLAYLGYDSLFTNVPVRTYYINEPGRFSMSSAKRKDNPERIYCNKLLWVNFFDTKLGFSEIKFKLRNIFAVAMYGFLAKKSFKEIHSDVNNYLNKILLLFACLPAKIFANRFSKE